MIDPVAAPTLSKTFSPNTIWVGTNSTLTITLRNTDPNTNLTNVSITDNLPAGLSLASTPASPQCGGIVTSTSSSVTLSGATITKQVGSTPGTCSLVVSVTSSTPGVYTNLIPPRSISAQQGVSNASAASAPLNVQAIGISKAFSPSGFQVNGTSTLTITLQNPTANPFSSVAVTDNLPAGLTISGTPVTPQCGGTVSSTSSSVTLTGGTIAANSSCTIVTSVTAAYAATYTNTIPAGTLTAKTITDASVTNVLPASANISVYSAGYGTSGSKNFNPNVIAVNGSSRLTINIAAPPDIALTQFSLSDALPSGLRVAATPNPTKNANCGGGTFAPKADDILLSYTSGSIPQGQTCTLAVNVTSSVPGTYFNSISSANISNAENRNVSGNFSASLTVSGIGVEKSFYPDTVSPDGISTLTITLTNTNTSQLNSVHFTDRLPSNLDLFTYVPGEIVTNGVVIAPGAVPETTCANAAITATPGSRWIDMTSGIVPAQVAGVPGICTIVIDVVGKGIAKDHQNTIAIGAVHATIAGTSTVVTNPSAANSTLTISPIYLSVNKSFIPDTIYGKATSLLEIELNNIGNNIPLVGVSFTDNLPLGNSSGRMSVADAPNISLGTCGGTLVALPGANSISYSGGSLAANSKCTLSLSVTVNAEDIFVNTIAATKVTSTNGAYNQNPAVATLVNTIGISVAKKFMTNPISAAPNNVSLLTITIRNTDNIRMTGMTLTDPLPAGMKISAFAPASTTCNIAADGINAVLSAEAGTDTISMSNAALLGGQSCTVDVYVTAPAAGSYINTIPVGGVTALKDSGGSVANKEPASDTLVVEATALPPVIAKQFEPSQIPANTLSALTFTITNPSSNTVALSGVGFTDTFPAGLTVASVPNMAQCGGSVTSTANSITLSGGTVAANSDCKVIVSVTANTGGSYPNTSGTVTSANGGTGNTASATLTAVSPPSVSKQFTGGPGGPGTPIAINDNSVLTLTLSNPAQNTVALTGVGIVDILPVGLNFVSSSVAKTCDPGTAGQTTRQISLSGASIPVGASCTLTATVQGVSGGHYDNTTQAVTSTNGGDGGTATAHLDVEGPGLLLQKSTSASGFRTAGDKIDYTYILTNTGTVALSAPYNVTDLVGATPVTVSCPDEPVGLLPGATVTCMSQYTVPAVDPTNFPLIPPPSITNTATATANGGTVTSNQDSVTVLWERLSLKKRTSTLSYLKAGDKIDYTYTLTNIGSVPLYLPDKDKLVTDKVGSDTVAVTCPSTPTSLLPGANITCTAQYTVPAGDPISPSVTNNATATAKDGNNRDVTSNSDSVTVNLLKAPALAKAFDPPSIPTGTTSVLTFTITNPSGNEIPLTGVSFSDTFPPGMTVTTAPLSLQCGGSVTYTDTSISLSGGTVVPNSSCTVSVNVTAMSRGSYLNTSGAVTSANGGTGNTATDTLTVIDPPSISKAFGDVAILLNDSSNHNLDQTTLSFIITNPNDSTLSGVGFSDNLLDGLYISSTPAAAQCGGTVSSTSSSISLTGGSIAANSTCTITVTVKSSTGGIKTNVTSAVTSNQGGAGAPSNIATLQVLYPALTLVKSISSGSPYRAVGDVVQYSYLLTNTGTVTLIGNGLGGLFTVTDNKTSVTCPVVATGLEPGDHITCTGSYTIQQSDLDYGSVKNTATAYGRFQQQTVTSNTDFQIAKAVPILKKVLSSTEITANGNSLADQAAIGEKVTYTLTLTVPKGATASSVLTDLLDPGLTFENVQSVTASAGLSIQNPVTTGSSPTNLTILDEGGGTHNRLNFNFGDINNAGTDYAVQQTIEIVYQAVVVNRLSNQAGSLLNNAASFGWTASSGSDSVSQVSSTTNVTVVEPALTLAKTRTVTGVDAGDVTTFSITVTNANTANDTDAYQVAFSDDIPSGLTLKGSPTVNCPGNSPTTFVPTPHKVTASWATFAKGASCTFTFDTTIDPGVTPGQAIPANTAELRWASIPDTRAQTRTGPPGDANDYSVQSTTAAFNVNTLQLQKSITATSQSDTSGTYAAVGEIVRYRLVTLLPEGTSPDLQLRDAIPAGMRYMNDGTTRVAFVSQGAAVSSTDLGIPILNPNINAAIGSVNLSVSGSSGLTIGTPDSYDSAVSSNKTNHTDSYASGGAVIFKLGEVVNTATEANASPEYIVLEYNAQVLNDAVNQAGTLLQNTYTAWINGSATEQQVGSATGSLTPGASASDASNSLTVVEPLINNLTKTVVTNADPDVLVTTPAGDAGDTFTYKLTFSNGANHTGVDAPRVRVATTAALTGAVFSASTPATLSGITLSTGSLVIDSVTLALNDRVLVKNQATTLQNGVYYVSLLNLRTGTATLTRAADFDESSEIGFGARVYVGFGTLNAGKTYAQSTTGAITLNTSAIAWTQVSNNPAVKAATTAAIGTGFSANQITGVALSTGSLVIDGVTLALTDRVLVKDQSASLQNGVYTVSSISGTATLARASDYDQAAEFTQGAQVYVIAGTVNAAHTYALAASVATLNTSPVTWRLADTPSAFDLVLSDPLPASVLFQSIRVVTSSDSGVLTASAAISDGSVTLPAVGASGTITLNLNSLAAGSSVSVIVTVKTANAAPSGSDLLNRATLSYASLSIPDCNISPNATGSCILLADGPGAATTNRNGKDVTKLDNTPLDNTPPDNTPPTFSAALNNYAATAAADIRLKAPSIDKELSPSPPYTGIRNVAVGEAVTYDILVTLPEGRTQTLKVIDTLPTGLRLDTTGYTNGYEIVSPGGGITGLTTPVPTATPSGTLGNDGVGMSIAFGNLDVSALDGPGTQSFTVRVHAIVTNVTTNQDGTKLTNSATLTYEPVSGTVVTQYDMTGSEGDATPYDPTVNVVEATLAIAKNVSPSMVDAGDTITYTITLTNPSASSHLTGYNLGLYDQLPDLLSSPIISNFSTTGTTAGSTDFEIVNASGHNVLQIKAASTVDMPLDSSITIYVSGTSSPTATVGTQVTNRANVTWTSYPGANPDKRTGADITPLPAGTTIDASKLNNYALMASAPLSTSAQAFISKSIVSTSDSNTSDNFTTGLHNVTIGEIVTYRVTVWLPEGVIPGLTITDSIPSGMAYIPEAVTLNLERPGGGAPALHSSFPVDLGQSGPLPPAVVPFVGSLTGSDPIASGSPYTDGKDVTFTFRPITVTDNNNTNNNVFNFTYRAIVLDVPGNTGLQGGQVTRTNGLTYSVNGATSTAGLVDPGGSTATVVEPKLTISTTVTLGSGAAISGDAGDKVTYTTTIAHHATSLSNAYDLTFSSPLPAEFDPANKTLLSVVAGGVDITSRFEISGTTLQTISGQTFDMLLGQTATVTLESALTSAVQPKQSLSTTATVNYTSLSGIQAEPSLDVDSDHERAYTATSSAAVTITSAAINKTISATSLSPTLNANVAVGETITYALSVSLPEGSSSSATVVDTLPAGLSYAGNLSFSIPAEIHNVTQNVPTEVGNQLTFSLGNVTVDASSSTSLHSFTIYFDALVKDVPGNVGLSGSQTSLTNTAALTVNSVAQTPTTSVTATVVEPRLQISKTLLNADTTVDAGTTLNYQIVISHTASSTGPAFDIVLADPLVTPGLPLSPASLSVTPSSGVSSYLTTTNTSDAINGLRLRFNRLDNGDTLTITYSSTLTSAIDPASTVPNTATLSSYDTIPSGGRLLGPLTSSASFTVNTNTISGFVYKDLNNDALFDEAASNGLSGISVRLLWAGPDGSFATATDDVTLNTSTDASGAYSFSLLRPGSYKLSQPSQPSGLLDGKERAGAPANPFGGSVGAVGTDLIDAISIPADSNQSQPNYNFGELPPSSISGLTWLDANGNAIQDTEAMLDGVTVTLSGTDDLGSITPIPYTTTSSGLYSFTNLRPGSYQVHFARSGYAITPQQVGADTTLNSDPSPATGLTSVLSLTTAQDVLHIDAGLYPPQSISGKVWYDIDASGSLNTPEIPLSAVTVTITWAGPDGSFATSDDVTYSSLTTPANGTYSFAAAAPGKFRVLTSTLPTGLSTPTYDLDGTATPNQIDLNVTLGSTNANVDFGYRGASSLGNYVWADLNNNGLQNGGELATQGVSFSLTWAGQDDSLATSADNLTFTSTLSNASGNYSFAFLPAGTFSLAASLPSGYDFAQLKQGSDTAIDSNFDPATATAAPISLGASSSDDSIDLGVVIYSISKSISSTSLTATLSSDVAVGEVITYDLALALQPGSSSNTVVIDTLPAGLEYVANSASLVTSSLSTSTPPSISSVSTNVNQVTFNLGTVLVNPGAPANQRILILRFQARVSDIPANTGLSGSQTTLANSATLQVASGFVVSSNPVSATVVEPRLQISKTLLNVDTSVDAGTTLNYQIVISHTASSTGPAFDIVLTDPLVTPGLPLSPASLSVTPSSGVSSYLTTTNTSDAINGLRLSFNRLDNGDTLTITYSSTLTSAIAPASTVTNTATLSSYDTIPSGGRPLDPLGPLTSSASFTVNTNAISGFVYKDLNNDALFDEAASNGLSGISVRLLWAGPDGSFATATDDVTLNTSTDASGAYSFSLLRPGSYKLSQPSQPSGLLDGKERSGAPANPFGGSVGAVGTDLIDAISIPADSNQSQPNYNFGELPPSSISGLTWLDANGNAIQDTEDMLDGVTVTLSGTDDLGSITPIPYTTTSSGLYSFTNLRPGSYQVHFARSGYAITPQQVGTDTTLNSDPSPATGLTSVLSLTTAQDVPHIDAGLYPPQSISGKVWYDIDASGSLNTPEIPLSAVTVTITWAGPDGSFATSDDVTFSSLTTPANGTYSFAAAAPGKFRVLTSTLPTGLSTPTYDLDGTATPNQIDLNVTLGSTNANVDFGYRGASSLGNYVWADLNNNGVQDSGELATQDVSFSLTWAGQDDSLANSADNLTFTSTLSNASGNYSFAFLPAGTFSLAATLPSGYDFAQLKQGSDTAIDSNFDPASATAAPISLGASSSDDSIDLGVVIYAISKSISYTSLPATLSSDVAVGEVITYDLALALQPGSSSNTVVIDTLPAGLEYVANSASLVTTSLSSSASPSISSVSTNVNQVTFNLGTVLVNPGAPANQRILILRFQARVQDVPANTGLSGSQTTLANSATLQVASGFVVSSNPVNATVVEPILTISKDFSALYTRPGDTVSVILQVTNTGNAPAYEVVVADPLSDSEFRSIQAVSVPSGFTFSAVSNNGITTAQFSADSTTSIPAGGSLTFTFQVVPKETLEPGVTLHNTATVTTYATLPSQDPNRRIEQPVSASADLLTSFTDLAIVKTDTPDPVHAGGLLTYTLAVQNNGPYDAHQITVTDVLPAGLTFVSTGKDATHDWVCAYTAATRTVECTLADLAISDSTTITITARPDSNLTGTIDNTATVSSIMPDPDLSNNQSTAQTTLDAEADLSIAKTALDKQYAGTNLSYTLAISNNGPSDAQSLTVSDPLPAGVTLLQVSPAADRNWVCAKATTVSCTLSTLAAGASSSIEILVNIGVDTSGTLSNTASVTSSTPDTNPDNNSSTALTTVLPAPYLLVSKTVTDVNGDGIVTPGELLEYTITINNQGQSDAFEVLLTDAPAANLALVPGSVTTTQGSVTTGNNPADTGVTVQLGTILSKSAPVKVTLRMQVASPLPAGVKTVSNQAVLTGVNFQPVYSDWHVDPLIPGTPTVTDVTGTPRLSALKTATLEVDPDKSIIPSPGDTLRYTVTITNSGDAAESMVVFNDTLDPNTTLISGTVSSSQGSVTTGNTFGDKGIVINIGTMNGAGAEVTITFLAGINNPLPAGTTEIKNQGSVHGQSTDILTDDPAAIGSVDSTLTPVLGPTATNLVHFGALTLGQMKVAIQWTTAAAVNNYGFRLKRADVNDYAQAIEVGFIPSAAASNATTSYQTVDTVPSSGQWFYWLVEVDNQGQEIRHSQTLATVVGQDAIFYLPYVTR